MDAGRRYISPRSEIKDFIAEIAVLRESIGISYASSSSSNSLWAVRKQPGDTGKCIYCITGGKAWVEGIWIFHNSQSILQLEGGIMFILLDSKQTCSLCQWRQYLYYSRLFANKPFALQRNSAFQVSSLYKYP